MIAILLCAGFATRMYPLTRNFPKPLLKVAGRPVLDYLMEQLLECPYLEGVYIVTNARFFNHFCLWKESWDLHIRRKGIEIRVYNNGVRYDHSRLGALRDLAFVLDQFASLKPAVVAAGDNIFCFSLSPIWQRFIFGNVNYVIALFETDKDRLRRTGIVELGPDDRVIRFYEKPNEPPSFWISPAIYFLQRTALMRVKEYLSYSSMRDAPGYFLEYLVGKEPVYAVRVKGRVLDIGSIDSYRNADRMLSVEPFRLSE